MYWVYVIKSAEGFRYTGMTEDLDNRLKEHNEKTKSFWTKRGSRARIYENNLALMVRGTEVCIARLRIDNPT